MVESLRLQRDPISFAGKCGGTGIRTHSLPFGRSLLESSPLQQPLANVACGKMRWDRDSNPGGRRPPAFKAGAIVHSAIPPSSDSGRPIIKTVLVDSSLRLTCHCRPRLDTPHTRAPPPQELPPAPSARRSHRVLRRGFPRGRHRLQRQSRTTPRR